MTENSRKWCAVITWQWILKLTHRKSEENWVNQILSNSCGVVAIKSTLENNIAFRNVLELKLYNIGWQKDNTLFTMMFILPFPDPWGKKGNVFCDKIWVMLWMNVFDRCFFSEGLALLSHDLSSLDHKLTPFTILTKVMCPECKLQRNHIYFLKAGFMFWIKTLILELEYTTRLLSTFLSRFAVWMSQC